MQPTCLPLSLALPPSRCLQDIILETAMDIARGMEYLHQESITHGDLKGSNVLLQTAGGHANQFVAKVADFGLSRVLKENQTATRTIGTVTHMPPELLTHGERGASYPRGCRNVVCAHRKKSCAW